MKKLPILAVTIGLALVISSCVPNRLHQTLATQEPGTVNKAPIAAPTPNGRSLQPQLGNANINLDEVVALLPPDAIPAILPDDVPKILVTAAEADAAGMDPAGRVLGVSINGDSRAYPLPFMSAHEIVNDEVGGKPIAATW
jgi:hypothetical protein